jgi:DNA invertase Pin-like site-specific DNA recombinase
MLIGYVRVSKSDGTQTLEPQRDAMLAAGVDPARIYEDLASGRRDDRPGLAACLKAIQPGNTLVLWKLDRLGRDLRHLVNTVEDLRTRGVGLKVLAGAGAQIDTTTANGRLAFGIFAAPLPSSNANLSPSAPWPVWPPRVRAVGWADDRAKWTAPP